MIKNFKYSEYKEFLEKGGEIVFEIDAEDIDSKGEPGFVGTLTASELKNGFESRPSSSLLGDSKFIWDVHQSNPQGITWTKIIVAVYVRNGKIIYKKLDNGKYSAYCTISKN